jgi:hypothetical protein
MFSRTASVSVVVELTVQYQSTSSVKLPCQQQMPAGRDQAGGEDSARGLHPHAPVGR